MNEETELWAALDERFSLWSGTGLSGALSGDARFHSPGTRLSDVLVRNRSRLAPWLEHASQDLSGPASPARLLTDRLMEWLHQRNQFLRLAPLVQPIEAGYRRAMSEAAELLRGGSGSDETSLSSALQPVFRRHQGRLATIVTAAAGGAPREVVNAEYSPQLQCRVLGISAADLRGPVLDVGCGPSARLVRELRSRGGTVLGIDRYAQAPGTVREDWLRFRFGRDHWQLVVSHHAFALHLLHLLGSGDAHAVPHLTTYAAILGSLRVGGAFAYAPSLPQVEAGLDPSRWQVLHPFDGGSALLRSSRVVRLR